MALNFKHRIEIIEERPNTGPWPGDYETVVIAKPWAAIKTLKGTEYNTATIAGNVGKTRFIIRYMKGLKPHTMKLRYRGITYDIESLTNDDEENRTITIIGKAILPQ